MSVERVRAEIAKLTYDEKLRLVHDLWDEIDREADLTPLSDDQRAEVERRLREHEANPGKYQTWEEVRREIEDRLR